MYRYSVDNAITYTSEDLVLFKESPFACWMERLTLENPDHGIPPNADSTIPRDSMEPQDDLADTLRAEGKNVVLVEWDLDEPVRRSATLEAMRHGVDFIVNGQLALGSLSGSANLLMRTSGYSDLGNYLYVPCNTQRKTNLHSALRLCFLADLLHSLQGQLPPQMLIIRGGSDVVPMQTEDHIYHYRAVKHRFMSVQHAFRKHKMPDPAESSHFGRWADCANEVLKQRALHPADSPEEEAAEQPAVFEQLQSAVGGTAYDLDEVVNPTPGATQDPGPPRVGGTLAEQARSLSPAVFKPSPSSGQQVDTLQNLAFIGSSTQAPTIGQGNKPPVQRKSSREPTPAPSPNPTREAPSPSLRNPIPGEERSVFHDRRPPSSIPPTEVVDRAGEDSSVDSHPVDTGPVMGTAHPLDSPGFQRARSSMADSSMVDLDATASRTGTMPTPPPALSDLPEAAQAPDQPLRAEETAEREDSLSDKDNFLGRPRVDVFNSSLITGGDSDGEDAAD